MRRYSKSLLLLMMLISWTSLLLFGRNDFKRFLPAGLFMLVVVTIEDLFAQKRKWWVWYEKLFPQLSGITPFLLGPFFIGSMWILKLSYGKFLRYIVINLMVDSLFTYFIIDRFKKFRIGGLVHLKKIQLSSLFFLKSLLLYGFQSLTEKARTVERIPAENTQI
ncbi:hypothetical protein [Bacillus sp. AK128]